MRPRQVIDKHQLNELVDSDLIDFFIATASSFVKNWAKARQKSFICLLMTMPQTPHMLARLKTTTQQLRVSDVFVCHKNAEDLVIAKVNIMVIQKHYVTTEKLVKELDIGTFSILSILMEDLLIKRAEIVSRQRSNSLLALDYFF